VLESVTKRMHGASRLWSRFIPGWSACSC